MHGVGVTDNALGLVALELTDEMPRNVEVRELRGLRGRLLIAILPYVGHAELGKEADVVGGMKFGHDDELGNIATPGHPGGRVDPPEDPLEVRGKLFTPSVPDRLERLAV